VRKHGLTIDSLLAAEIVTADGQFRRVDAEHEPDLFWAIRGGGGNFGVVTRFQFRLHDVSEFTGGILVLPATADTIAGFIAANEAAPEELSAIANVMPCPPMPFVPEDQHGKLVILAMMAFAGPADAAEKAYAPFRALATPLADLIQTGSYTVMYPSDPEEEYHPTAIAKNLFMDSIDRDVAQGMVDTLESIDAPMKVAQLRVLGGAYARVPADATAYAHRSSRIMVNVAAFYMGEDDRIVKAEWVERFARQLTQSDHGAYVNFVGDEGEAGVRAAYPGPTYQRLADIKRRFDPDNLFRLNQNIVPA
jgi:FAD/FMN-containing dehydrogenase